MTKLNSKESKHLEVLEKIASLLEELITEQKAIRLLREETKQKAKKFVPKKKYTFIDF